MCFNYPYVVGERVKDPDGNEGTVLEFDPYVVMVRVRLDDDLGCGWVSPFGLESLEPEKHLPVDRRAFFDRYAAQAGLLAAREAFC